MSTLRWLSFYNDEVEEEKHADFLCNIGYKPQERLFFLRNMLRKKQTARRLVISGEKLRDSNRDNLALNVLDQAIQLNPDNLQARTVQAQIYEKRKDIGKAQDTIYIQAQIYEKKGNVKQARQLKKRVKELEEILKEDDML